MRKKIIPMIGAASRAPRRRSKESEMPASRVRVAPVEGATEMFTAEFTDVLLALHDRLGGRVHDLIAKRAAMLARASL